VEHAVIVVVVSSHSRVKCLYCSKQQKFELVELECNCWELSVQEALMAQRVSEWTEFNIPFNAQCAFSRGVPNE